MISHLLSSDRERGEKKGCEDGCFVIAAAVLLSVYMFSCLGGYHSFHILVINEFMFTA